MGEDTVRRESANEPASEAMSDDELLEAIAEGRISGCSAFRALAASVKKEEADDHSVSVDLDGKDM